MLIFLKSEIAVEGKKFPNVSHLRTDWKNVSKLDKYFSCAPRVKPSITHTLLRPLSMHSACTSNTPFRTIRNFQGCVSLMKAALLAGLELLYDRILDNHNQYKCQPRVVDTTINSFGI